MVSARTRYLVAMGVLPAGLACNREPPTTAGPGDASRQTTALASPDAATTAADVPSTRPPPPEPTAPETTIERRDAGAGTWDVIVHRPPSDVTKHVGLPTCPSGRFCTVVPKPSNAKNVASAPAPYEDCAAHSTLRSAGPSNFDPALTRSERELTPNACCYAWHIPCPGGRPLRDDEHVFTADVARREDWSATMTPAIDTIDATTRAHLAVYWLEQARAEHASVASFNRFALQLLALGAAPALVSATLDAARDEIRHAAIAYGLAARYGGIETGPGKLALPDSTAVDPVSVVLETLRDGCVGESVAAEIAREASRCARDPEVAEALAGIAADEEAHAELAWRTVAWLATEHGAPVHDAIRRFSAGLAEASDETVDEVDLSAHGALGVRAQLEVRRAVLRDVVRPCLDGLLGGQ